MGQKMDFLTPKLIEFIRNQKIFFVGTAACTGKINVSPKGTDSMRVLDKHKIVWLNLTGSGNETAAHIFQDSRMTIMFCSFDKKPLILRLYGKSVVYHKRDAQYHESIDLFPKRTGARQVIEMDIELVQTSCGFGVPLMDYKSERNTLIESAEKKGLEGIEAYWKSKNRLSLDGFDTGIIK